MTKANRRSFLKQVAAGITLPASIEVAEEKRGTARVPISKSNTPSVPHSVIPDVDSLRSVVMPHRFGDLFNPPGLTNQWGCAQAAMDIVGIRSIAFPPFAQGEMNTAPLASGGELLTGVLYLDGEYFASKKIPIDFVWQPDHVKRNAHMGDLQLSSTMIVPFRQMAVLVALKISNHGKSRRKLEIKLALNGGITKSVTPWNMAYSPGEFDNSPTVDQKRGAVLFRSLHSKAFVIQGSWPRADVIQPRWLIFQLDIAAGETREFTFGNVLGEEAPAISEVFDSLVRDFPGEFAKTRKEWNDEIKAAFTPNNGRFSGFLPTLVTRDVGIRQLYHSAAMSALYFKRNTPQSVYGTTYVTLAPRYWETTTFLWDISLSAMLLAILDPAVLRSMIETWMQVDVHKHVGTEYLTGSGVGPWYSVNDFAMCRMSREYLRWTGDQAWLDKDVAGQTVLNRLIAYATHWRDLDISKHGLADYGGVSNLLEAVSSYVHEVAGLNAANVYNLRFVAELLEQRGKSSQAQDFRLEAQKLVKAVLELYVPGKGIWHCRLPDGRMNEVRHCYDFGTVLTMIGSDLSTQQKSEMVRFFREELQSPRWMRALSTRDLDVTFSIRPDHQWTGAYCCWPALALAALFEANEGEVALRWIQGLAETTRQGPLSQAHFVETAYGPEIGGGALKAPSDQPFITDWACVSGCAYLEPIVESLFGIEAGLFGKLEAKPKFGTFDPDAELRLLRYQGKDYVATKKGIRPA